MENNLQNMKRQKVSVGIKILSAFMGLYGILVIINSAVLSLKNEHAFLKLVSYLLGLSYAPTFVLTAFCIGLLGIFYAVATMLIFRAHRFGWWISIFHSSFAITILTVALFVDEKFPSVLMITEIGIFSFISWYLSKQETKNTFGITQTLSHFYPILLSCYILVLPLLNLPPWFSPPDWGKTIAFRIIFSVLLFLFVWNIKSISLPSLKKKESIALILLLILIGLFALATLFSFDRSFSLWGTPSRSGGFINFALIILFAISAFFVFKPKDWQKTWDIAIFVGGAFVAMLAIFQWRGWLPHILVSQSTRPQSTLGNDIQLGIYLLLLIFPTLAFAFQEKKNIKKLLYVLAAILFLFVIILTGSRGSYLGIAIGFSYFILLFPFKKLSYSLISKFAFLAVMLAPFSVIYYVNTHPIPKFVKESVTLNAVAGRLQLEQFVLQEPRFSTWKVGIEAIKARPLLGYGPENFEIGFDKYYDPTIPNLQYIPGTSNSWWDRAHNFFVDNASQAGIATALIYVGIFLVLIFQLQKVKNEIPNSQLTAHGLQAAFIAYLVADFFGFDTFSTYLISFLLVAYAIFLVRLQPTNENPNQNFMPKKWMILTTISLAVLLLWFNWQFTLKPLQINTQIVIGQNLAKNYKCDQAVFHFEKALLKNTFLNAYVRATYFDALRNCDGKTLQDKLAIAEKEYNLMKDTSILWPHHTRNWIFLGQTANVFNDFIQKLIDQETFTGKLLPERKQQLVQQSQILLQEAQSYFEKASILSPKHQEIYLEWPKTFFLAKDYEGAKAKAKECIAIDERTGKCWFLKGVAEEFLKDHSGAMKDIAMAKSKEFNFNIDADLSALSLLLQAYLTVGDTGEIIRTYIKLIALKPNDVQLHASLALAYAQVEEFAKARAEAKKVLELNPKAKDEVKEFLKLLP